MDYNKYCSRMIHLTEIDRSTNSHFVLHFSRLLTDVTSNYSS